MAAAKTPESKVKCGVLGATGSVGQRFVLLLADHPALTIHAVGASDRSEGRLYRDAVSWRQATPHSPEVGAMSLRRCEASDFSDCDLVFSGLGGDIAGDIEMEFAKAEIPVFSNAKDHRRDENVPLIVPTVNLSHLDLIRWQRKQLGLQRGFLVCNSNCAVTGVVIPLAALQARFGPVEDVEVFTEQAISGAGYPGVPSMDIFDNVVPYIPGEEDKMQFESQKILGRLNGQADAVELQTGLSVNATCTRVGVTDGHMAFVSLRFAQRPPPPVEQIKAALAEYVSEANRLQCPSAPAKPILVLDSPDRPQPRLDRETSGGFAVCVGRLRTGEPNAHFDLRFAALSHNTVIGAAGASILNAEAAVTRGFLQR